jgi:serine/threonine-protein kinase
VSRLRAAVQDGAATGQIRGDVATDLLNLIRPLQNADGKDVDAQVAALRRKIADRTGEGSLSDASAAILKARLSDLDRAAGM